MRKKKQPIVKMNDTCLICEGGGFKIAFTAGVLDAFLTTNFRPFNRYVGVSGGTIALSYFLSRQFRFTLSAMQYLAANDHFLSYTRTFDEKGLMDIDFIKNVAIEKIPFNFQAALENLKESQIHFVATNRTNGKAAYFQPENQKQWLDYAVASSTLPFITKGIHLINGQPFCDGGWSDPLPVKWAYQQGIRKILLVRTNPKGYEDFQSWTDYFGSIYYRNHNGLRRIFNNAHRFYNQALEFIDNPPDDLEIIQINPEETLKCTTYGYTKTTILEDYRNGVERGIYFLNQLNDA